MQPRVLTGVGLFALGATLVVGLTGNLRALGADSAVAPAPSNAATPAGPLVGRRFADITSVAGIRHTHHRPILDSKLVNIMSWVSSVGAAAAAGDYNRDGWMDLYVTDSAKGWPNHLYRNNGDGTFTDVAAAAGLADANGDAGASMDCIWGDIDNDGWSDLYLVRWGYDALFRNNGDGTFTDVTAQRFRRRNGAPGTDWANGNAAVFIDFNHDGRLDIYVGNYFDEVDLWHLANTRIMHDSFEKSRNAGRNFLYLQEPDGIFKEVGGAAGVDDRGWTLAVGAADVDNDGWPDLYCADDFGPDQLFLNNRDGTFRNVTGQAIGHDTKKGMNVDFGDYDNDGWLDIYVANITTAEYLQEGNMLWHNDGTEDGHLTLTDVALEAGVYDGGWGWGAKFFDYDCDADLDIMAVNGFISAGAGNYWYALASWTVTGSDPTDAANWPPIGASSFSGYEKTRVWRNDGLVAFSERARELGLDSDRDGRGVVCFDLDNDGDLDVFVANQNQPPQLFRNEGPPTGHWMEVALEGDPRKGTSRDAVGARVTVVTAGGRQIRERDGGNGFSGQSDPRLHFGLGGETNVKLLEVRWPDGGLQYLENLPADRQVTLRQDPVAYTAHAVLAANPARSIGRDKPAAAPPVDPAQVEKSLGELEAVLSSASADYAAAAQYRAECAAHDQHDRAIHFLEQRVAAAPNDSRWRIELACALVDKIPTCGGMAAIVCKGSVARQSLDQLDIVIAAEPDSWVAHYCRGLNHLHWPRALRHSASAVADFERCLALQQSVGLRDYHLRVYLTLGDAHAKNEAYADARRVWRDALQRFPAATALQERLAIADDGELLRYIEKQRSLDQPIDTGLAFLNSAR
jgi:hypothetical protein